MPWKEGVEAEAVNTYRSIVKYAVKCDEDVDAGLMTPAEAYAALNKFAGENAPKAPKKEKGHA